MAERELPGEAHQHVPRLAGVGEVQDERADRQRVGAGQPRERDGEHEQDREQARGAGHDFFPNRPWGRSSRTRINRPKLNMLLADGAIRRPASASDTPIRTPPTRAPAIEPIPPTMTITKPSSV